MNLFKRIKKLWELSGKDLPPKEEKPNENKVIFIKRSKDELEVLQEELEK